MRLRRLVSGLIWLTLCAGALLVLVHYSPVKNMPLLYRLWTQPLEGPLVVPVQGVRAAGLADTWGATRSAGRTHEGIDIFARCGHPVVSATEGIVLSLGDNKLGGMTIRVLGPGHSMHYYAHLSRYGALGPGDHVLPGDPLGAVGDTGNARGTPCHLHYGIYMAGGARNPYPYLRPAPERAKEPKR
ncbi:MAG: M23 family metallopeptidase [Comamonadaceae bacterium]|nr:MAG: M23 family metallopeptidase [Comamonadaceae bacterium]